MSARISPRDGSAGLYTEGVQAPQAGLQRPSVRAAKRAPRAAFPSGCLAAQTKRWAEGIRVPGPLAGAKTRGFHTQLDEGPETP